MNEDKHTPTIIEIAKDNSDAMMLKIRPWVDSLVLVNLKLDKEENVTARKELFKLWVEAEHEIRMIIAQ